MHQSSQRSIDLLPLPSRQQVLTVLFATLVWTLLLGLYWKGSYPELLVRTCSSASAALLFYCLLEHWPKKLPQSLPRWVLQVGGVALSIPMALLMVYVGTTKEGEPSFWQNHDQHLGFLAIMVSGILFAPWIAMSALLRQRDEIVREQARQFERERGALERQALDSRLRLLQSQVTPHFLFNTLANVRELVDSASPQAPVLLDSLITYLRASIPQLDSAQSTLGQELSLVEAYLALMQMRMPDRLQFSIDADEKVHSLPCPPLALLTLIENAVRHGIDPSEIGGEIKVCVLLHKGICRVQVQDTGVGLQGLTSGMGTGLSTLRERLRLTFGEAASLEVSAQQPHGLLAEILYPIPEEQR
ncbi:sensor histidine kinase [Microbulbifer sp. THAF38]|uniref:sensor histidine kinase n=1 Tax=Microbulbifer sp. THAF38 TaxID=2587856 RepID=UPI001268646E|nr:histidine kinase [Microbulbifer sp. THAF38]QFT56738.1 Sensor histidine kinase YpdA [Microbulbifer sp. THAF38]